MASIVKYTALEPLLTGPLLYVLTRGSPELKSRLLEPLGRLPFKIEPSTLITSLKWLLALGVVGRLNSLMNRWAINRWKLNDGGAPWVWNQEICVITGGSGGIGSELVKKLATTGMKVVIMDLQPPPESLSGYRNVSFYECDITNPTAVHSVASTIKSEVGAPTILCNNAGIGKTYNILDVPHTYLEKIMHINLISHWYTVQEFLPGMIAAKKGHVVTTASMASYSTVAGMVDYCVTKAGAMAFHEGLTQELKHRYNAPYVKTTSVHPYWVKTNLINDWEESLRKINNPIMTPEFAAKHIAKAILSGQSSQFVLPPTGMLNAVVGSRGWPIWMQEAMRDSTRNTTKDTKDAKEA
ncbi:MAG: hypothetical protein M1828_007626 [Chrysothrix sp. TS-e1954]|nr:MAG: hypothetical protein M1828_007626 [Chrysothrix sp. TS-e1954]